MRRSLAPALALAVAAIAASPTAAGAHKTAEPNPHQFVGTAGASPRFSGESAELNLKPFTVTCEKEKGSSSSTLPSKTLTTVVKFSDCEAEATLHGAEYELKAKFTSPITLNYHANGVVEIGSGGTVTEGKLEGAGPVEIAVKGAFKCVIAIEAGTYPAKSVKKPEAEYTAATYTDEEVAAEVHKQPVSYEKLNIATALTKLPYDLEGEFCEEMPKTEYKAGTFTSSLLGEVKKGSVGWE